MLRLAVWFYQLQYRVVQFLAKAQRTAERERHEAHRRAWEQKQANAAAS